MVKSAALGQFWANFGLVLAATKAIDTAGLGQLGQLGRVSYLVTKNTNTACVAVLYRYSGFDRTGRTGPKCWYGWLTAALKRAENWPETGPSVF